ncbi:MAG: lysoplasmalogenase family protein [Bacilli bacterium]|nr:lysoplasmalogenase family protein [Bacilli bacterium]
MIFFFIFISLICVSVFIYLEVRKKYLGAIIFKALASFSFILLFFSTFYYYITLPDYNIGAIEDLHLFIFICLGLVLGLIGDLILALRPLVEQSNEDKLILAGTISFFIGHIFYVSGIIFLSKVYIQAIIFAFITTLIVWFVSKLMKINWRRLFVPSILYTFLIFFLVGETIFSVSDLHNSNFSIILIVGSILFAFSDLILSQTYFNQKNSKGYIISNLSMYYLAQIAFALSWILFVL